MPEREEIQAKAQNERRLGLLIMENKSGAALTSAITHLRAAADAWGAIEVPTRRAECLMDLSQVHSRLEQFRRAADAAREALRIFLSSDRFEDACDAASAAGNALLALGEHREAERCLRQAEELANDLNEHLRMAQTRLDLTRVLIARRAAYDAINVCNEAREIFDDYRKGTKSAECHEQLGAAHAAEEEWEQSRRHYERAAEIFTELGRPFEASQVLSRFADVEADRGNHDHAIDILLRCLKLQKQHNNKGLQAQTYRLLGMVEVRKGDIEAALSAYEHSLDLCSILEDDAGRARTLYQIGSAQAQNRDPKAALDALEQSLAACERAGNHRIMERVLAAISKLHRLAGEHERALEIMHRWVEVLRELGERQDQLRVIGSIAKVHQERGSNDEAESHLRRLISVCTEPGDEHERAFAEHGLAVLLIGRKEYPEAAEHFERALSLFRTQREDPAVATRLPHLLYQYGNCLLQLERAEEALDRFNEALEYDRGEEANGRARARVLVGIGNAYGQLGRENQARQFFDQAARLCEQQGDLRATRIIRRATGE